MVKKEILTPEHELWDDFNEKMCGKEGINIRDNPDKPGYTLWDCCHTTERSKARKILESYEDIDVEESLLFFADNGACCDCEIVLDLVETYLFK